MLYNKNYLRRFDWVSFLVTITLTAIGLLFVFSTTYHPGNPHSLFLKKQLLGVASGWLIYFMCCYLDHRTLMRWGYFAYFGVLALLMFTLVKGSIGMGAQRWINLGLIAFQPSELAKVLFPVFAVTYFHHPPRLWRIGNRIYPTFSFTEFVPLLIIFGISFILILKQPDLGTALILAFSGLIMFWLLGMPKKFFTYGLVILTLSAPLLWQFTLKDYQKQRIKVFLGYGSSQKERYQTEQAKIAIGSGGMFGKGFLHGTQNKFRFLPEGRTDFIFAVIAEEFGFVGALTVVLLFALLFWRLLVITLSITEPFMQLLAIGLTLHIIFSALINILMVLGLLPIVGIPLPLISYGLSNLWVTFGSLGWLQGIFIRRS